MELAWLCSRQLDADRYELHRTGNKPKRERALEYLLFHPESPVKIVAQYAGVTQAAVYGWLKDSRFMADLERRIADPKDDVIVAIGDCAMRIGEDEAFKAMSVAESKDPHQLLKDCRELGLLYVVFKLLREAGWKPPPKNPAE